MKVFGNPAIFPSIAGISIIVIVNLYSEMPYWMLTLLYGLGYVSSLLSFIFLYNEHKELNKLENMIRQYKKQITELNGHLEFERRRNKK